MLADRALQTALEGGRAGFVRLVAPSFLEQLRAEMPDADDEVLGGVLIAGFLEGIPFSAMGDVTYDIEAAGDRASVYVWGVFLDDNGAGIELGEAEAVRIPLIRENGRWYIDLLDL